MRKKIHDDRSAYVRTFHRENYVRFVLAVNKREVDIIEKLNSVENRSEYLKNLIRADIEKESE